MYVLILALAMLLSLASCGTGDKAPLTESSEENAAASVPEEAASTSASSAESEKNGDIMILYTSDVHCGVDQGFGYAGLQQIRDSLESEGYTTLLVDDGDSVQGEPIGTMTKGESIIDLMNGKVTIKKGFVGKVTIKKGFVGKVTITITSKATKLYLAAEKKITVTVNPSATNLSSVKGKGKKVTVKWKKNNTAKGYELQFSLKNDFRKIEKTVRLKKKTRAIVKGLKKGTYYVRIRTVNGVLTSKWSKAKSVKVG